MRTGGCQCGGVRYHVSSSPLNFTSAIAKSVASNRRRHSEFPSLYLARVFNSWAEHLDFGLETRIADGSSSVPFVPRVDHASGINFLANPRRYQ